MQCNTMMINEQINVPQNPDDLRLEHEREFF